jgi:hypothetical protein
MLWLRGTGDSRDLPVPAGDPPTGTQSDGLSSSRHVFAKDRIPSFAGPAVRRDGRAARSTQVKPNQVIFSMPFQSGRITTIPAFLAGQSCHACRQAGRSALKSWAARQRRPAEDVKNSVSGPPQKAAQIRPLTFRGEQFILKR